MIKNKITFKKHKTKSGIYAIINLKNKKKYIGLAKSIYNRFWQHSSALINNTHFNKKLQEEFNEYGESTFEFKILEICDNNELLKDREIYWVSFYDTYRNGYNLTPGGGGTWQRTKETRKNLSNAKTGTKLGKDNPMYGKNAYEVWIERYGEKEAEKLYKKRSKKLSEVGHGRKRSAESIQKYKDGYISGKYKHPRKGKSNYDLWLRKNNIKKSKNAYIKYKLTIKTPKGLSNLEKEKIIKMYNEDKISVLKLAKKFSVHRNTIYKVLNSKK